MAVDMPGFLARMNGLANSLELPNQDQQLTLRDSNCIWLLSSRRPDEIASAEMIVSRSRNPPIILRVDLA